MTEQLDRARDAWLGTRDGASGSEYGELLEAAGDTASARAVYDELIRSGYLIGYYALAWLEHDSGNAERARDLLRRYLDADGEPDEQTELVAGVLGHWLWHDTNDPDAEGLLIRGADAYPSARADLAHLYRATGRSAEAEGLLKIGVDHSETESFIVLGNLLDETGRTDEAKALYVRGFELGDAHCAYNLALVLLREGRNDEADEWAHRAAEAGDSRTRAFLSQAR
ncbi:tetratricopeptide repeat protein [Protaetiibacter mangrovi]|uniref:Tetratricopeptide repeat protein n=1 Tax=Protaetiibacter mangrovi TaxID=2970926 RepID=A0ABT1ZIH9_9MICO|nr:tetratricopeptide repeat protein [Protaetiibacter mangrovi]MCS0500522.1 tetratricopeptide repeat protein [Protaetiibacter mangrovi]TPX02483.1 tetratricopeptide repeat protein [Schumannella luteola]